MKLAVIKIILRTYQHNQCQPGFISCRKGVNELKHVQ